MNRYRIVAANDKRETVDADNYALGTGEDSRNYLHFWRGGKVIATFAPGWSHLIQIGAAAR